MKAVENPILPHQAMDGPDYQLRRCVVLKTPQEHDALPGDGALSCSDKTLLKPSAQAMEDPGFRLWL